MKVRYKINGKNYSSWEKASQVCRSDAPVNLTRITQEGKSTIAVSEYPVTWIKSQIVSLELSGCILATNSNLTQVYFPIEASWKMSDEELKIAQDLILEKNRRERIDRLDIDIDSASKYPNAIQAEDSMYFTESVLNYKAPLIKGFRFEKSENLKEDIMKRLEEGIRPLFETQRYKEYLKTAAKFHEYSFNNTILLLLQCPEATHVAGFNKWKELGRAVNKGETGLKIIACGEKKLKEKDVDGKEKDGVQRYFFPATVFDFSQTSGKDLVLRAFDAKPLDGTVERFEEYRDALIRVSGCPVIFDAIRGDANGYFSPISNEIHIKESLSQQATLSTLVHEITHSRMHADPAEDKARDAGRRTREVEAESVAFVVCERLGLDTSSKSFGYIAGWSKDKELPELKKSLELITKEAQKLSGDILDVFEGKTIHQKKEDVLCQKR